MRIVALADTHTFLDDLPAIPDGDVLVHAGDACKSGSGAELGVVIKWMLQQPHRTKIFVAGNHDRVLERKPEVANEMESRGIHYLKDRALVVDDVRFYGSPYTPEFHSWSFMKPRGAALREVWAKIPETTNVLITHGPPHGIGDRVGEERAGCEDLRARVNDVAPLVHLFGHIHNDRGHWCIDKTTFVNVTTNECDAPCTVIDIDVDNREVVVDQPPPHRSY